MTQDELIEILIEVGKPLTRGEIARETSDENRAVIGRRAEAMVESGVLTRIEDTYRNRPAYRYWPTVRNPWQPRHFPPRENGKHGRISIYCHACQRRHMLRRVHGRYVQHCQSVEWRVFTEDELR